MGMVQEHDCICPAYVVSHVVTELRSWENLCMMVADGSGCEIIWL